MGARDRDMLAQISSSTIDLMNAMGVIAERKPVQESEYRSLARLASAAAPNGTPRAKPALEQKQLQASSPLNQAADLPRILQKTSEASPPTQMRLRGMFSETKDVDRSADRLNAATERPAMLKASTNPRRNGVQADVFENERSESTRRLDPDKALSELVGQNFDERIQPDTDRVRSTSIDLDSVAHKSNKRHRDES